MGIAFPWWRGLLIIAPYVGIGHVMSRTGFTFGNTDEIKASSDPLIIDQARRDMHERNMAAIKAWIPGVFEKLVSLRPRTRLLATPEGGIDLEVGGAGFHGRDATIHSRQQIDDFWKHPNRHAINVPSITDFDRQASEFMHRLVGRMVDSDMGFYDEPRDKRSYFLIVLGVGLGFHLDKLMEQTECSALILFEPNVEFLYQSTFTYDWATLFERLRRRGVRLSVTVSSDEAMITGDIRDFVRTTCPYGADGMAVFTHYESPVFSNVRNAVATMLWQFISGIGFFDDELFMIRHTYKNLMSGGAAFFNQVAAPITAPCFIVGGGPSKDTQYDFLRENQDKAIVVSCGTALENLLAEGIRPDFHFVMERDVTVYEMLKATSREVDLSGICMVASTTVDPRIKDLFEHSVLFFRRGLSPFPIFAREFDGASLHNCDPHVANAALDFMQRAGGRTFYFFGVDLGSLDRDKCHSEGSWPMRGDQPGFKVNSYTLGDPIPGNFGGTVFSNPIFRWVRGTLERAIAENRRGHTYFNCSDGGFIQGAVPTRISRLSLRPVEGGKEQIVERLVSSFPRHGSERFQIEWEHTGLGERIADLRDEVLACLDRNSELSDNTYLRDIMQKLYPRGGELGETILLRGTVAQALIIGEYFLNRLEASGDMGALEGIVRDELRVFLGRLQDEAEDVINHLEKGVPYDPAKYGIASLADAQSDTGLPPPQHLRRAAPMPDHPSVGRNHPCPCGSGFKYEQCHGRIT
jgi:hypothetical protein